MRTKRILVVDDDKVTLQGLGVLLSQQGYEVEACEDPAQALQMALMTRWDLIVLDLGLPSPDPKKVKLFDGFKVLSWLKRLCRQIPVVVFTGREEPETSEQAIAAGAIAVVHKRAPASELLQAIRRGLALAS